MTKVLDIINKKAEIFENVSDSLWEFAETKFNEVKSSELLWKVLEEEDFKVQKGVAGMDTAFIASYGTGKPVIGILGEYDALDGLSQKAGLASKEPVKQGGSGHGCGHHALGAGSLAAAVAIKDCILKNNISGTIRYYGCPAEEGGSGKVYMVREGLFDDVDAVLAWHPGPVNVTSCGGTLSNIQAYFKFYGTSAHAAVSPHLGRSALDAVEIMNVGANFLREHIISDARLHYAITNAGGIAPNVVQSYAEVLYLIRAPKPNEARAIYDRVINLAKGAALMTDTQVEVVFDRASSNVIPNKTLSDVLNETFNEVGAPCFDSDDTKLASQISETLSEAQKSNVINFMRSFIGKDSATQIEDKVVSDTILPYRVIEKASPASTDVGDVSWKVPTAQITVACYALGSMEHSWQVVAQGKSETFHKGMLKAGEVLASTALKLFENPNIIKKAKEELLERTSGQAYVCPIPLEVKPKASR